MNEVPEAERIVCDYEKWLRSWTSSEKTISARRTVALNRLREWGLEGMTGENVQRWLGRPKLSRWTRSTYHAHLNDFCAWLVATGHLTTNPMESIRKPTRPSSLPRPLTEPDVERVLATATGRTRDWILIALLSGLRVHEIAKLRGEDVTEEAIFVEGKGGTRAMLPTHPDIWTMASRYPRQGYWFPGRDGHIKPYTITTSVSRVLDTLGLEGSIHRCRHTYGTRLLRGGTHIRVVQKLMRHASLATTATYTAVDENEMRAAISRLTA